MGRIHSPRRGSMQFSPRSRAARPYARVRTWPISKEVKLLGFAGYKAGMTHTFVLDIRKDTPTTNQEVFTPVTVLECPPLSVFAVRVYEKTPYGLNLNAEFWTDKVSKFLPRATDIPKKSPSAPEKLTGNHITVLVHTKPFDIDLKKTPEIFEIAVGGEKFEDKLNYAKSLLGKEIHVSDLFKEGELVDVTAVSKGKGTQGPIKRFHVKL
ncbi:TPA: 50S ribosomal protein L3, partial [archaeon]|nr:50S ribosomal protein L3 [Candidatus Naiadarchaeales archaeon SRR2090153.bin1042]